MSLIAAAIDEVPSSVYEAADCLRGRHRWVDELAARIDSGCEDCLDEVAGTVLECAEHDRAWAAYGARVAAPAAGAGEESQSRGEAAGPVNTPRRSGAAEAEILHPDYRAKVEATDRSP